VKVVAQQVKVISNESSTIDIPLGDLEILYFDVLDSLAMPSK